MGEICNCPQDCIERREPVEGHAQTRRTLDVVKVVIYRYSETDRGDRFDERPAEFFSMASNQPITLTDLNYILDKLFDHAKRVMLKKEAGELD